MNWREHILVDPAVCHGQACIRGTRIPVSVVLADLAAGKVTLVRHRAEAMPAAWAPAMKHGVRTPSARSVRA